MVYLTAVPAGLYARSLHLQAAGSWTPLLHKTTLRVLRDFSSVTSLHLSICRLFSIPSLAAIMPGLQQLEIWDSGQEAATDRPGSTMSGNMSRILESIGTLGNLTKLHYQLDYVSDYEVLLRQILACTKLERVVLQSGPLSCWSGMCQREVILKDLSGQPRVMALLYAYHQLRLEAIACNLAARGKELEYIKDVQDFIHRETCDLALSFGVDLPGVAQGEPSKGLRSKRHTYA